MEILLVVSGFDLEWGAEAKLVNMYVNIKEGDNTAPVFSDNSSLSSTIATWPSYCASYTFSNSRATNVACLPIDKYLCEVEMFW